MAVCSEMDASFIYFTFIIDEFDIHTRIYIYYLKQKWLRSTADKI